MKPYNFLKLIFLNTGVFLSILMVSVIACNSEKKSTDFEVSIIDKTINKREAVLRMLDPSLEQNYIPASFFIHFDKDHKF